MSTPEERLNTMLDRFEAAHRTDTANPGANLRTIIENTPQLRADLLESISRGNLETFEGIVGPRPLGYYNADHRALAVSLDQLDDAARSTQAANSIRFTLGHEIQHGVNRQDIFDQDQTLRDQARATARTPSPHDYTEALQAYNATSRSIETTAEIAGFNTLASYVTARNPQATLKDLYDASPDDMRMYIHRDLAASPPTYTARPGLTIGEDLKIASTPENLEAMGRLFYDANGYPPREVGRAIGMIRQEEVAALAEARSVDPRAPAPEIRVDLDALGLSGARLPAGFTDSSRPRPEREGAQQEAAPQGPAQQASPQQGSPQQSPAQQSSAPDAPGAPDHGADPRSAAHPDHGYFQALRDRLPASVPDNAVAQAMLLAKGEGMTDFSKVNPQEVAFADGKVWIGGQSPGVRVGADIAQAPSMEQVGESLKSQPPPAAMVLPDAARLPTQDQAAPAIR